MIYIFTCAKFAWIVSFARKSDNTDQKSVIFDLGASFLLESSNFWNTTWEPFSKSTMNFWTETVHEIVHYSCTRSVPWCTIKILQFKAYQWISHTRFTPQQGHIQVSTPFNRDIAVLKIWKVRKEVLSSFIQCNCHTLSWRLRVMTALCPYHICIFDLGASFFLKSSNFWHTTWEPYFQTTVKFSTEKVHKIVHFSCIRPVPRCTIEIVQF